MRVEKATTVYYRRDTSDKVYCLWLIEVRPGQYITQYAFGRRGASLKYGAKTSGLAPRWKAETAFNDALNKELRQGYQFGPTIEKPPDYYLADAVVQVSGGPRVEPASVPAKPSELEQQLKIALQRLGADAVAALLGGVAVTPKQQSTPAMGRFDRKPKRAITFNDD